MKNPNFEKAWEVTLPRDVLFVLGSCWLFSITSFYFIFLHAPFPAAFVCNLGQVTTLALFWRWSSLKGRCASVVMAQMKLAVNLDLRESLSKSGFSETELAGYQERIAEARTELNKYGMDSEA